MFVARRLHTTLLNNHLLIDSSSNFFHISYHFCLWKQQRKHNDNNNNNIITLSCEAKYSFSATQKNNIIQSTFPLEKRISVNEKTTKRF